MKVLFVLQHRHELWQVPSWFLDRLRQEFPALEIVNRTSYDDIESQIRDAEVLFTLSLRPEQFQFARNLRWIHSPSAAVHQFSFPELVASDVILTNAREVHGAVVAEHAIAQILALAKCLPQAVRLQQRHIWGQEDVWNGRPRPREIAGATVGLVGLGSIGRNVARHASALGMRVIAVRENLQKPAPPGVEKVYPSSGLDSLLQQSDYIVLSPPLTPETHSLIGAAQLARMKPEACLINVGRGPLIDETALAEALRSRKIGGAALDVFVEEPLPAASPLWDLENLLITPHTAGITEKLWDRHYAVFTGNLRRYLDHQPLHYVVDKKKGY